MGVGTGSGPVDTPTAAAIPSATAIAPMEPPPATQAVSNVVNAGGSKWDVESDDEGD